MTYFPLMMLADCNVVTKDLCKRFLLLVIIGYIPLLAIIWVWTEIPQRIYRSNSWNASKHLLPHAIELSTSPFFHLITLMCLIIELKPKNITTTAINFTTTMLNKKKILELKPMCVTWTEQTFFQRTSTKRIMIDTFTIKRMHKQKSVYSQFKWP